MVFTYQGILLSPKTKETPTCVTIPMNGEDTVLGEMSQSQKD